MKLSSTFSIMPTQHNTHAHTHTHTHIHTRTRTRAHAFYHRPFVNLTFHNLVALPFQALIITCSHNLTRLSSLNMSPGTTLTTSTFNARPLIVRYVFGGRSSGQNVPGVGHAYTQIYDPRSDSWSLGASMPYGRGGTGALLSILRLM